MTSNGRVARIREGYRRLYPALGRDWYSVVLENDAGVTIEFWGQRWFAPHRHVEVRGSRVTDRRQVRE